MPALVSSATQVLVIRLSRARSAEVIVSVLDDLARDGILRICDLEVLSRNDDRRSAVAIVVVEHLWPARLQAALSEANAQLVADTELPSLRRGEATTARRLARIQELNELRRVGTLTEGEFATAKRELLQANGWSV